MMRSAIFTDKCIDLLGRDHCTLHNRTGQTITITTTGQGGAVIRFADGFTSWADMHELEPIR